jgi:hypothetical protein
MAPKNVRTVGHPVYAQPEPTADPTLFKISHPSDDPAYKIIDQLNKEHKLFPFPAPRGGREPTLTLEDVFGGNSAAIDRITSSGQIVFHATGDCGSLLGPQSQCGVADKMVSDFAEADSREVPQFNLLLGDVVYSFGESQYYYDQFYEPYRNYAAPILAVAGNHDGMVSPLAHAKSLDAYLRNFCASSFMVTPDAGGLSRTAQIQPGVFFTLDAPFVRILALYSNTLEDPGVIADGTPYKGLGTSQLDFLKAALGRVKKESFKGALIIASHHPAYTLSRHGWSPLMTSQIDAICESVGVWPTAVLAGHAHNYQRFTRTRPDGIQIPYVVCGNGGHGVQKLSTGAPVRAPQIIQKASSGVDQISFDSYDDTDYGYLRIIATATQLRIEYHPASDGSGAKTPDDQVTVDLQTHRLGHFVISDLGRPAAAAAVRKEAAALPRRQRGGR